MDCPYQRGIIRRHAERCASHQQQRPCHRLGDLRGVDYAFDYDAYSGTAGSLSLPNSYNTYGHAINDSGMVAGVASGPSGYVVCRSNYGTMFNLGSLPGSYSCQVHGINASGWVVGTSYDTSYVGHAFLYTDIGGFGHMGDLGVPAGYASSGALGINDTAQVAAFASPSSGPTQAFRIESDGTWTPLGSLVPGGNSYSYAINAAGQVVGQASTSLGNHAFLWSNGAMTDLNSLILPTSGWTLQGAYAMNNQGQIVGLGVGPRAAGSGFLLTPAAAIALANATSAKIITGGTATLSTLVTNSASSGSPNLNYTIIAAVQSGIATLGMATSGAGSLTPGSSQPSNVSATSANLGVNTIQFTASDPNAANAPQTTIATLTVLDHSNASLSSGSNQTTQTINFGSVLRGATILSQGFTIYNRAANTSADYTANLKLLGFSATGDTAFGTNLSAFSNLAAGQRRSFTASLNTSKYTTSGNKTITMSASQLADDSGFPGAGNNNNGGIDHHAARQRRQCDCRQEQFAEFLRHRFDRSRRPERELRQP